AMDSMAASNPSLYTISNPVLVQYIETQYNKRLLFSTHFSAVVLGLGRATTLEVLTLTLNLFVVFWSALRSCPPAFPPKLDGGGILLLCQILGTNFTCLLCSNSRRKRGLVTSCVRPLRIGREHASTEIELWL